MGCCDQKSLKRVTDVSEGVTFAYKTNKLFILHKDDIRSFSSDGQTLSVSLSLGYTKEFKVEELLNYDEVLDKLTKLTTGAK